MDRKYMTNLCARFYITFIVPLKTGCTTHDLSISRKKSLVSARFQQTAGSNRSDRH